MNDPIHPPRLSRAERDVVRAETPTPDALFTRPVRELVDEHQAANLRLLLAEVTGQLRPSLPLALDAVRSLATAQAAVDVLLSGRWVGVRTALRAGGDVDTVARALGLTADEIHLGLRFWADQQHEHALMTAADRDEVYALLDREG